MAKDYAHRGNGNRQTSTGRGLPGWVWLLAGIAIGFVGAVGYYISRPAQVEAALEGVADKKPGRKKIEIPPKQQSRFAFYDLLPKYEVVVPRESLKEPRPAQAQPPQPADAAPGQYLIQVGSFRDRKEAEQQKANLALVGVESRIEKVTIDDGQTWFRVRIGPEKDQRRVETILARLEENDIEAVVMMVPN
jgi:cell division protein FtsN